LDIRIGRFDKLKGKKEQAVNKVMKEGKRAVVCKPAARSVSNIDDANETSTLPLTAL